MQKLRRGREATLGRSLNRYSEAVATSAKSASLLPRSARRTLAFPLSSYANEPDIRR